MITLALDQSTTCTGYSVFYKKELIEHGKVKLGGEFFERVERVKQFMLDKIKELSETDNVFVCLEDIQYQPGFGVDTFEKLAKLLGCLELTLVEQDIPYTIIPSVTWKSYSGIKGKARAEQKKACQEKVLELYNLKVCQDEADAIMIGKYGNEKRANPW